MRWLSRLGFTCPHLNQSINRDTEREMEQDDQQRPGAAALSMTLLDTLLARPPDPLASTTMGLAAAEEEEDVVPEEGEKLQLEEPLPSAWDPSDWWGADEEAVAAAATAATRHMPLGSAHYRYNHHHDEALSSRPPPTSTQPLPLPRPWNPEGNGGGYYAQLSADRRTARYVGKGANHAQDVGAVKADRPLPRARDWYYFEVGGSDAGKRKTDSNRDRRLLIIV